MGRHRLCRLCEIKEININEIEINSDIKIPDGTADGQTLRWEADAPGSWQATDSLVVADSGNVGIGTGSPAQKLVVQDGRVDVDQTTDFGIKLSMLPWGGLLV